MDRIDDIPLADRLLAAITVGDVAGARACFTPDAVIWHNTDGREQSLDENMSVMAWIAATLGELRVRTLHREALSCGFLQRHVVEAVLPDGRPWAMASCIVASVRAGLIARIDEYIDSAPGQLLRSAGR